MYFKKLLTFLFVHAGARVFFVIAHISSSAAPLRDWNAPPSYNILAPGLEPTQMQWHVK